jgi:competence protein ComEA
MAGKPVRMQKEPGGSGLMTRQEKIALLAMFILALLYAGWHLFTTEREHVHLGEDIGLLGKTMVVEVEGAVANPGPMNVPEGGRIADAVQAAGGFLPDADREALDLNRHIVAGERIVVPFKSGSANESTRAVGGRININTANKAELMRLPGIGEELAGRIMQYRSANGPFQRIEDIMNVEGIGEGKFRDIPRLITTGN